MKVSEFRELLKKLAAGLDRVRAAEISAFIRALAKHDDLDLQTLTLVAKSERRKRAVNTVRPTIRRGASDAMIREYLDRLKAAYQSDDRFEVVAKQIEADKKITKSDVERLFNEVFKTARSFPDKRTKVQRVEDLRRERLNRIRFDAA